MNPGVVLSLIVSLYEQLLQANARIKELEAEVEGGRVDDVR